MNAPTEYRLALYELSQFILELTVPAGCDGPDIALGSRCARYVSAKELVEKFTVQCPQYATFADSFIRILSARQYVVMDEKWANVE